MFLPAATLYAATQDGAALQRARSMAYAQLHTGLLRKQEARTAKRPAKGGNSSIEF
jgi:hypothetical protein